MKVLLVFLCSSTLLLAGVKEELYRLYQQKAYKEGCSLGMVNYTENRKDEEFVSLYAFSCLNADYIDRLAIPISNLKYSKEARSNAAYFSVILMQKKLLYHALVDGYEISGLKLPSTGYVLSKVFDLYANDDHAIKRNKYIYQDRENPSISYALYIMENERVPKMVIEEYYDTIMTNRHIYW